MIDKTIKSVSQNDCTGCMSCYNVCPVNAISMIENEESFIFPVIDEKKCIYCGKCFNSCMVINPPERDFDELPICYAMMGNDDLRMKSSSGGIFTYLADYVLNRGGSICGAAWTQDWLAEHIVTDKKKDLERIRGSKYFQSNMGKCMNRIKMLLNQNKYVLFSGTGCQVEALYAFLGRDYDKLITMDIVCHGVPSASLYKKYINDIAVGREVSRVSFRDKELYGWSTTSKIDFSDGSEYYNVVGDDPWYKAFLSGLMCRHSCEHCKYANMILKRMGDISAGDFWGIGQMYKKSLYSPLGVSLVLLNSPKGKKIYNELEPLFKTSEQVELWKVIEIAEKKNGQLLNPKKEHKYRKLFFDTVWNRNFCKAVDDSMNGKFNIGVVGWWYNENYGGALTYFALHQVLKSMGLSVLMIDKTSSNPNEKPDNTTIPRRFALKHYNISDVYDPNKIGSINPHCGAFISGSDQLYAQWAWEYGGKTNYLDFSSPIKNMIGYASSFGNSYNVPQDFAIRASYFLHRFNSLSVREDYAVDIVKENFGLNVVQVLDPVFICDFQEYHKLADQSSFKKENDYMLSFFLDPDQKKREALLYLSQRLKRPHINLIHAISSEFEKNKQLLNVDNIKENADVEDWIAYYRDADFIITDSFHGTCFAIIFRKPFISIANKKRGDRRFVSLLKGFGLLDRLVDDPNEILTSERLFEPIDYDNVYKILEEKKSFSYNWLHNAIFNPPKKSVNNFSIMDKKIHDNLMQMFRLQDMVVKQRKEIEELKKRLENLEKNQ